MTEGWAKPDIYNEPAEVKEHTLVVVHCSQCRKPVLRVIGIPGRPEWMVPTHDGRSDQPIGVFSAEQGETFEVLCKRCDGLPRLIDVAEVRRAVLSGARRPIRLETIHHRPETSM